LEVYREAFGVERFCWVPMIDYYLCSADVLNKALDFFSESDMKGEPVVVHCAGGRGRTGLVLAAWLVFGRAFTVEDALQTVRLMRRNPYEAVEQGHATINDLQELLRMCQIK